MQSFLSHWNPQLTTIQCSYVSGNGTVIFRNIIETALATQQQLRQNNVRSGITKSPPLVNNWRTVFPLGETVPLPRENEGSAAEAPKGIRQHLFKFQLMNLAGNSREWIAPDANKAHWFHLDRNIDTSVPVHFAKVNVPCMIRCQNCETNYPTKYQYQRHQCEFNADNVVLKPNVQKFVTSPLNNDNHKVDHLIDDTTTADDDDDNSGTNTSIQLDNWNNAVVVVSPSKETSSYPVDVNTVPKDFVRTTTTKLNKYACSTCNKQFVTRGNLERHQTTHENPENNICEYCKKQFVSENRLRIHKENHCKKSGDISKFYRSDVTVWKCIKCNEVFSSSITANYHLEVCDCFYCGNAVTAIEANNKASCSTDAISRLLEKISTEILLQCEFCNRTYADKQVLLAHQRTHGTAKNYECVICGNAFSSYVLATQHWMKKCSERANLFYLAKLTYCEECDRTFKSHELLYAHKIKKRHYTPKLDNTTNNTNAVCIQLQQQHGNLPLLPTDGLVSMASQCLLNQDEMNQAVDDVLCALQAKSYQSNSCNKNVKPMSPLNASSLDNNTKRRGRKRKLTKIDKNVSQKPSSATSLISIKHEGGSGDFVKYQCERCAHVFNTVNDLEQHRDKEHAANYTCDECGQVLTSARALLVHSRAHKSLKPYVCDTCGRSYSQTSHLWQHMRFHQGIKPFACPHEGCEARYTIRPDLKDHIRKVHTRERPFKCATCGKCFLTGSVYYQHRLIHTEDRRYGCDMCEKRFFRADALNNHRRIHTNERPYPCMVCGRMFRQKGDRNKHFRTQHPDSIATL